MLKGVIFEAFGDRVSDRAFMTDRFTRGNQEVIDSLAPQRLLVFSPKEGWESLCEFLGAPVPAVPFPRVNSRDDFAQAFEERGGIPPDPETAEQLARANIDAQKAGAFGARS